MAKILITGGTGSLGKQFAKTCSGHKVIIYSRDEMKQNDMDKIYPEYDYFLGDVRDLSRLKLAMNRVDYVVHAAALKIVPKAELDPLEYVKTNIDGARNVIEAALDKGVEKVVAVSTDKAVNPINLYGASKLVSDKLFLAANSYNFNGKPQFSVVRYGNVMGSRGSVLPHWLEQAKLGYLDITHPDMTRFMFTLEEAAALIWKAFSEGGLCIPKIKSMAVKDMAGAISKYLDKPLDIRTIGIRPGEKMHESLSEDYHSNTAEKMTQGELVEWIKYNYGTSKNYHSGFITDSSISS